MFFSVAEIFANQYWCFLIIDFQCIFDISAIMHLQSHQRWIISEWLWNFFKTRSQNSPISVKWQYQSQLIFCILKLSYKHITFERSRGTPCRCLQRVPQGFSEQFLDSLKELIFDFFLNEFTEHASWMLHNESLTSLDKES